MVKKFRKRGNFRPVNIFLVNRKGQAFLTERFVYLLIGALVFVFTMTFIYNSFFRLSTKAIDSYDKNVFDVITKVKDGELVSRPLVLDDHTAILVFDNGYDFIKVSSDGSKTLPTEIFRYYNFKISGIRIYEAWFKKPEFCGTLKPCICLCRNFEVSQISSDSSKEIDEFICSQSYKCQNFEGYNIKLKDSTLNYVFPVQSGGSVYDRNVILGINEPRLDEIYIEKKGSDVFMCSDYPCNSNPITKFDVNSS